MASKLATDATPTSQVMSTKYLIIYLDLFTVYIYIFTVSIDAFLKEISFARRVSATWRLASLLLRPEFRTRSATWGVIYWDHFMWDLFFAGV